MKENFLSKLEVLDQSHNSKDFWKEINNLNPKQNNNDISSEIWSNHFKNLCNSNTSQQDLQSLPDPESLFANINTILDFKIEEHELNRAIKRLKSGKAKGPDMLQNEMIKHSCEFMAPVFVKIFNLILETGTYPDAWSRSYLITIFKSGELDNPSDYRGLCISSCLSKLFSSILNERLYNYMDDKLSKFQAGFRHNHRTTDHIFTLNAIVKKYLKRTSGNKKIYCCFVDFSKAFDTLWRPFILKKLFDYNIGGKFYSVIKNMLISSQACVKMPSSVSQYFAMSLGIKQGDPMSPTIFNIFLNDLADEIGGVTNSPPLLNGIPIPLLMYADDVVLLSETPEGLQNSLDKLYQYSVKWKLTVNLKKTKVVIFENRKSMAPHFLLGNRVLTRVDSYKYLGVTFYYTGNFSHVQADLYLKTLKAMFGINGKICLNSLSPEISKKLFNSMIKPIIMYGSEVWGTEILKPLLSN